MSKKYILFVNLRRIQQESITAILSAKELGYEVILLTNKKTLPDYIKKIVAHISYVNTYDISSSIKLLKKLAGKYHIEAVPSWTESDIELVARINHELKLPGLSIEAAGSARNKFLMKVALNQFSNLLPKFKRVSTYAEFVKAVEEIGFPAIIKPTGASGSKGIFELHSKDDLKLAFAKLKRIARPEFDPIFKQYGAEFIVEEFITGPEFSVEGLVFNNTVHIVGITDKWTTDSFHLEYQHIFPSKFSKNIQNNIKEKSTTIIKALGFNNCAFHLEAKYTPDGFRFIEVAARPGGDYITSFLVPLSTGINLYSQLICVSLGRAPTLTNNKNYFAGVRFLMAQSEGTLQGWRNLEKVLCCPYVEHAFLEFNLGKKVVLPPNDFVSPRVASFIVKHTNYKFVNNYLKNITSMCQPIIK